MASSSGDGASAVENQRLRERLAEMEQTVEDLEDSMAAAQSEAQFELSRRVAELRKQLEQKESELTFSRAEIDKARKSMREAKRSAASAIRRATAAAAAEKKGETFSSTSSEANSSAAIMTVAGKHSHSNKQFKRKRPVSKPKVAFPERGRKRAKGKGNKQELAVSQGSPRGSALPTSNEPESRRTPLLPSNRASHLPSSPVPDSLSSYQHSIQEGLSKIKRTRNVADKISASLERSIQNSSKSLTTLRCESLCQSRMGEMSASVMILLRSSRFLDEITKWGDSTLDHSGSSATLQRDRFLLRSEKLPRRSPAYMQIAPLSSASRDASAMYSEALGITFPRRSDTAEQLRGCAATLYSQLLEQMLACDVVRAQTFRRHFSLVEPVIQNDNSRRGVQEIAEVLAQEAYSKGSTDNITVLVLDLRDGPRSRYTDET